MSRRWADNTTSTQSRCNNLHTGDVEAAGGQFVAENR